MSRRPTRQGRPPHWLIFSITLTGILANTLVNAPLPDIVEHFGLGDGAAGLIVAAGAIKAAPNFAKWGVNKLAGFFR